MSFLVLDGLKKSYGSNHVVQRFDLAVERGEFISFLGSSGCGKTTTLRMVAGFEVPTAGAIRIDGRDMTALPPHQRKVGMVFQSYALFPNMTVAQNVAFGLKVAQMPTEQIRTRVGEMLDLIKLPQLADRYPYQMSGGQQQRVALARAIATKPQILLLDEPLSALDAKIRVSLRDDIRALQRELGITTIYVTHDQEEALSMSDRIVVMSEGRMEQVGTPFEIYNRPKTHFVASFVGHLNVLRGTVVDAGQGRIAVEEQELLAASAISGIGPGGAVTMALRPEAISFAAAQDGDNVLRGTVADVNFLGSIVRIRVSVGDQRVSLDTFNSPAAPPPRQGQAVVLSFARSDLQPIAESTAAQ